MAKIKIWRKNIISRWNNNEVMRYEWVSDKGHKIDVTYSKEKDQGFEGSNQVSVYIPNYGGWVLNTPKNFRTKKEAIQFVSLAKKKLESNDYGKKVAFPN